MKRTFFLLFLLCASKFTILAETNLYIVEETEIRKSFAEITTKVFDSPIDEYGKISWEDEKLRLDGAVIRLRDYAALKCLFLIYFEPQENQKKVNYRIKRILKYLVDVHNIDDSRILFAISEAEDNQRRTIILGYTEGAKLPLTEKHKLLKGEDLVKKMSAKKNN